MLESDIPQKLVEKLIEGHVTKRTLDDAEDFDRALNRIWIIPLHIGNAQKKEVEIVEEKRSRHSLLCRQSLSPEKAVSIRGSVNSATGLII